VDSYLTRGSASIHTRKHWHPILRVRVDGEVFSWAGHPLHMLPATAAAGVSAAGIYPNAGDGLVDAATSTSVTLDATGVPTTVDLCGYALVVISGANVMARVIRDYNTTTRVATVDGWTVTPSAGDPYFLGFDVLGRGGLTVKAEFEGSGDSCAVYPYFSFWPYAPKHANDGDGGQLGLEVGSPQTPHVGLGRRLDFAAVALTTGATQSGYYHADSVLTEDARGAMLARVWLPSTALPAGSRKVALYLGAA
jgi:hypothetical protein